MHDAQFTLRIDRALFDRLHLEARRLEVSRGWVVRQALRAFFAEQDRLRHAEVIEATGARRTVARDQQAA